MVANVTIDNNTININRNIVTLTLSWGEPFNNFDPIVNYTVSCSSDVKYPPNFTTTDNAIIITNLTTMTNYTFSVVATNSFGSGEAGVVMITTPSKVTLQELFCQSIYILHLIRSFNTVASGLPDMSTLSPRVCGPRASGVHISK